VRRVRAQLRQRETELEAEKQQKEQMNVADVKAEEVAEAAAPVDEVQDVHMISEEDAVIVTAANEAERNLTSLFTNSAMSFVSLDGRSYGKLALRYHPLCEVTVGMAFDTLFQIMSTSSWRRSIVVRTMVSAGKLYLSCTRLLAGRVTALWLSRQLSVTQHGQLSLPSFWGQLMSSYIGLRRQTAKGVVRCVVCRPRQ